MTSSPSGSPGRGGALSDASADVGNAETMFAVDGAVVAAALDASDPTSRPRPGGAPSSMNAAAPSSDADVDGGSAEIWDEDTPPEGVAHPWNRGGVSVVSSSSASVGRAFAGAAASTPADVQGGGPREPGEEEAATARVAQIILSTTGLDGGDRPLDVLSVRAEGPRYAEAFEALKRELRYGCAALGGDALVALRVEREEGGRILFGTGTVVRRKGR